MCRVCILAIQETRRSGGILYPVHHHIRIYTHLGYIFMIIYIVWLWWSWLSAALHLKSIHNNLNITFPSFLQTQTWSKNLILYRRLYGIQLAFIMFTAARDGFLLVWQYTCLHDNSTTAVHILFSLKPYDSAVSHFHGNKTIPTHSWVFDVFCIKWFIFHDVIFGCMFQTL